MVHNLPTQLTSFVGRQQEVADLRRKLESTRLLTVTGPGGIGKTRLAIEAARADLFGDVCFTDLSPLLDQALVPASIASALGIAEISGEPLLVTLTRALQSRRMLLILDTCEHIVLGCAVSVEYLLQTCDSLTVLATSREPLNMAGEILWSVPPMAAGEAAALFVERASAAAPGFRTAAEGDGAIESLCERLDGLPLAIELAAAYVRVLAVPEIATRLGERFDLLASRGRRDPARHQTLRALVDWSYERLLPQEQELFRKLSVFAGGGSLEAIEAICADGGIAEAAVLPLLRGLVEKSLVVAAMQDGAMRYRMLDTLRQHSGEKLREAGEESSLRDGHLQWFTGLAERGKMFGAEQATWLRFQRELENFRVALDWARVEPAQRGTGLRLAAALARFWWYSGQASEGWEWLRTLLTGAPPDPSRVKALAAAILLCVRRGDLPAADSAAAEALPLARRLGDPSLLVRVLTSLIHLRLERADLAGAEAASEEALALSRQADGHPDVHLQYGRVMAAQRRWDRARASYEEALHASSSVDDRIYTGIVLCHLGNLQLQQGELAAARQSLEQSVFCMQEIPLAVVTSPILSNLAGLVAAEGDLTGALKLAGATLGLRKGLRAGIRPTALSLLEARLQPAYEALDPVVAEAAWAEGAAMSLDDAIAYALRRDTGQAGKAQPSAAERPGGLTPREVEVLRLMAAGKSNREIAERLVVSTRTVVHHIEHVYQKIGARNRAEAAIYAVRQGLLEPEARRP